MVFQFFSKSSKHIVHENHFTLGVTSLHSLEYWDRRSSKLYNLSDNAAIDPANLNMANVMILKVKMTRMNAIKTEVSLKLNIRLGCPFC